MTIAYFDCFSGAAGDMLLASLIDAGAPLEELIEGLKSIKAIGHEWTLQTSPVTRSEGCIAALHVQVGSIFDHKAAPAPVRKTEAVKVFESGGDNHNYSHEHQHDQDMQSLNTTSDHNRSQSHDHSHSHGHDHGHDHGHSHEHRHSHSHSHGHGHSHWHASTGDGEPLRNLDDVKALILSSGLPASVKEQSIAVFTKLGKAEAYTHGTKLEEIHFHEVGALDSIIDTVGVVFALHLLGVTEVYSSPLPFGQGRVRAAHGLLPVPAPATLRLFEGIPTVPGIPGVHGELVTPTGAALIATLAKGFSPPVHFIPHKIGIGAGTKDFPGHPNIVRAIIGTIPGPRGLLEWRRSAPVHISTHEPPREPVKAYSKQETKEEAKPLDLQQDKLVMIEANVDDMSPEVSAFCVETLLKAGALDAWTTPAQMKKGRGTALTLCALGRPDDRDQLLKIIFAEATTLGVRAYEVDRFSLQRKFVKVRTPYGSVQVKIGLANGKACNFHPEYEDCKILAQNNQVPLKRVIESALVAIYNQEQAELKEDAEEKKEDSTKEQKNEEGEPKQKEESKLNTDSCLLLEDLGSSSCFSLPDNLMQYSTDSQKESKSSSSSSSANESTQESQEKSSSSSTSSSSEDNNAGVEERSGCEEVEFQDPREHKTSSDDCSGDAEQPQVHQQPPHDNLKSMISSEKNDSDSADYVTVSIKKKETSPAASDEESESPSVEMQFDFENASLKNKIDLIYNHHNGQQHERPLSSWLIW